MHAQKQRYRDNISALRPLACARSPQDKDDLFQAQFPSSSCAAPSYLVQNHRPPQGLAAERWRMHGTRHASAASAPSALTHRPYTLSLISIPSSPLLCTPAHCEPRAPSSSPVPPGPRRALESTVAVARRARGAARPSGQPRDLRCAVYTYLWLALTHTPRREQRGYQRDAVRHETGIHSAPRLTH